MVILCRKCVEIYCTYAQTPQQLHLNRINKSINAGHRKISIYDYMYINNSELISHTSFVLTETRSKVDEFVKARHFSKIWRFVVGDRYYQFNRLLLFFSRMRTKHCIIDITLAGRLFAPRYNSNGLNCYSSYEWGLFWSLVIW